MPFTPPSRDFTKVRNAELVLQFDPDFAALKDELRYVYGAWTRGISEDFHGLDLIEGDPIATKAIFDKVYGAMSHFRDLVFHEKNTASAKPISRDRYDYDLDERGNISTDSGYKDGSRLEDSRDRLRKLKISEPAIWKALHDWATDLGFMVNQDATD